MHSTQEITWTPELAYAIGLVTTDGNLSPDGRHFSFVSNDKDLMETFARCLHLNNKIVPKKSGYTGKLSGYRIQFGNATLYRWMLDIGLMPNKSKRLSAIKIPDEFFFPFLRGHLDGDGTIRKYQDPLYPKSKRLYVTFLSASEPHLIWINQQIQRLLKIRGFMRKLPDIYSLTFNKYDSIVLLNEMYPAAGVPCLTRKLMIAAEFVGMMPR